MSTSQEKKKNDMKSICTLTETLWPWRHCGRAEVPLNKPTLKTLSAESIVLV